MPDHTSYSATAGPILGVKLIPDRNFQHGGLNYGFVEYHDLPSAERAINTLNGRRIFDTEIKVNWAYQNIQAKEDLSQHFHVFVGDLSPEITDDTLKKAFSAFGSLTDARVMWDVATGKSRGYGFLAFRDKPDADQAIAAMNGEWLGSRAIRVNWANQRMGAGGQMEVGTGVAGGPMRISNLPPFLGPPGSAAAQQAAALAALDPDAEPQAGNYQQLIGGQTAHMGPLPAHMRQLANMHANKPLNFEVVLQQAPPSNTTVYVGNLPPSVQAKDIMPLFQGFGYIPEIKVQGDKGYAFVKLDTHNNAAQAIVNVNGSMLRGRQIRCNWGREKLGSDTSIIANQANGVTSDPVDTSEHVVSRAVSSAPGSTDAMPTDARRRVRWLFDGSAGRAEKEGSCYTAWTQLRASLLLCPILQGWYVWSRRLRNSSLNVAASEGDGQRYHLKCR